ncbi:MAG: hypothetical protein PHY40_02755 [Patescibacteria group bacterium]|nr:hypothetical protein [Patescibacteria group bacterium]
MNRRISIESQEDGVIKIFNEEGKMLEKFFVKENLQRALDLLKKINGLKTKKGVPIYEMRKFKGKSVWAFQQHNIFWNYLRNYVMYEPIIKFLHSLSFNSVKISENLRELEKILKINGLIVVNSKEADGIRKIKILLKIFLAKIFSITITLIAFLKLFFSRSGTLVYTPDKYSKHDCDFRFAPVYDYLRKNKIDFIEVLHTLLGGEFYKNFFKRKRPVIYLEALTNSFFLNKKNNIIDIDFVSIEQYNVPYITRLLSEIDKTSQTSIRLIKIISLFFKLTKIKRLVAIDDVRFTNELVMACGLNNIKTYAFQHGHFTKYHVGWMNYGIPQELSVTFDKLFVWNDYWKNILFDYSSQYNEKNVSVGGCLRKLPNILYEKSCAKITNISQVSILLPFEGMVGRTGTMMEIKNFIIKFLNLNVKIFFKTRPDSDVKEQLSNYGLNDNNRVEIVSEINKEVLFKIDAVVGLYSTFLNEMIFYDKPIFLMKTSFDLGHRLTDDGLVTPLEECFNPKVIVDGINNFSSKKKIVWTETINIEQTLNKIFF